MRLHLPKRLLHAVIASLVTASAALCTLGSAAYAGHADHVFYINSSEVNTAASMDGYASFDNDNGVYTYVNTDPTGKDAVTSIKPGDSLTGTITALNVIAVSAGKELSIAKNGNKIFSDLLISSVNIAAPSGSDTPGSVTFTFGATDACHNVKINSVTGTLNVVNYSNLTFASGESAINLGTVTLNSGSITNTGTLNLTGSVSISQGYIANKVAGTLAENAVNDYGTFSSFALSDLIKGDGNINIGENVSWSMNGTTLSYSEGSFSSSSALKSTTYYISDVNEDYDFANATALVIEQDAGTVSLTSTMPDALNKVTINKGATLNLNSKADADFRVTLNGGVLANNGSDEIGKTNKQVDGITLTADSEVSAEKAHGILASDYGKTSLSLGSNTLTKTGSAEFFACNTEVTGTGTLKIESGSFNLYGSGTYASNAKLGDGVTVELAGGGLAGSFTNEGSSTIHASKSGTVSSTITNNGTLKVTSEAGKIVTFSGAITSVATDAVLQIGDTTDEGTAIGGTAKLTAALNAATVGQIKVLNGSSLTLDGGNANGNYAGTITVDKGGSMLATNNGNYNIVNGGNGKLVLNGEFTIDTTNDTNNVNGISGSGVVKTAQNARLNIVCEASGGTSTLDESGTTTPTSYTSNFNGSVEASGSAKTVSLVFTGPSEATDNSPESSGTTVSLKSLSATNGSTLNAKGIAAYDADTDTGGLSVSELVIGTGSKVQAWGSGDTWSASAEATVLMKGAEGAPVTLTVGTAGQTGSSTLNANLVLDGATVTLNNALTMGSTLTLDNVTLSMSGLLGGHIAKDIPITLFTGVDSLTFTQLNESGVGTTTTATDAITTGAIDASTVFSGLGKDDFWLTYTGTADGGIVALVAQRDVPEPTTATLSLLALMGLAARRRRRKA